MGLVWGVMDAVFVLLLAEEGAALLDASLPAPLLALEEESSNTAAVMPAAKKPSPPSTETEMMRARFWLAQSLPPPGGVGAGVLVGVAKPCGGGVVATATAVVVMELALSGEGVAPLVYPALDVIHCGVTYHFLPSEVQS